MDFIQSFFITKLIVYEKTLWKIPLLEDVQVAQDVRFLWQTHYVVIIDFVPYAVGLIIKIGKKCQLGSGVTLEVVPFTYNVLPISVSTIHQYHPSNQLVLHSTELQLPFVYTITFFPCDKLHPLLVSVFDIPWIHCHSTLRCNTEIPGTLAQPDSTYIFPSLAEQQLICPLDYHYPSSSVSLENCLISSTGCLIEVFEVCFG
ncbi:hypothetical protein Tco_1124577 [Tanacetum coccineum]|uniref:Uncharacterized protein n=1 Tax=Tanacetum coccineum TaxID=301880 RepID=A0ABQ5J9B8_9ASTR